MGDAPVNWFRYGYSESGGHDLYGSVNPDYRRRIKKYITEDTPYDRLPAGIPYVGHRSLFDDVWLVLGKPPGTGTFYCCLVDDAKYREHGFSPYRLIVSEPPPVPLLSEVGSGITSDMLPLPVDSVEYLQFAARLFKGLDEPEGMTTHHSIVSRELSSDGAFFVFERGSGDATLERFSMEEVDDAVERWPDRASDELAELRAKVAELTRAVERADLRLRDAVTLPALREELSGIGAEVERRVGQGVTVGIREELAVVGAEVERRVGEGVTVGIREELEGIEQVLKRASDWPTRLERVEDSLRAQADQFDAIRNILAKPPARKWQFMRGAAVVVVVVGVLASLYSDLDELEEIASDARAAVWGSDATLTGVAADVTELKDDIAQVKQTVFDPKGTLNTVADDVATMLVDVETVKEAVSGDGGKLSEVASAVGSVKTDVAGVMGAVTGTDGKLVEVASAVGSVKTDVAGVMGAVTGADGKLVEVASKVDSVKTDVAGVMGAVTGADGKLVEVASKVDSVKTDVAGVMGAVTGTDAKLDKVASLVASVKSDVVGVMGAVTGADGKLDKVSSLVASVKSDVVGVMGAVTGADGKLDKVSSLVASVKSDVVGVMGAVTGADGKLVEVTSKVDSVQTDVAEVKQTVDSMKDDREEHLEVQKEIIEWIKSLPTGPGSDNEPGQ